jgi:hypothetical protein
LGARQIIAVTSGSKVTTSENSLSWFDFGYAADPDDHKLTRRMQLQAAVRDEIGKVSAQVGRWIAGPC